MSGLDKNRNRNQSICFRMSLDERQQMEARIKVCGLPKGDYMRRCMLHSEISISVGKYQSDRLSLELRKLRERIDRMDGTEEQKALLSECKALLDALLQLN